MKENSKKEKSCPYVNVLENFAEGLQGFCPKRVLPRQVNELIVGNIGGCCKPPNEFQGATFQKNMGIKIS